MNECYHTVPSVGDSHSARSKNYSASLGREREKQEGNQTTMEGYILDHIRTVCSRLDNSTSVATVVPKDRK
jgi:hypothetical protein